MIDYLQLHCMYNFEIKSGNKKPGNNRQSSTPILITVRKIQILYNFVLITWYIAYSSTVQTYLKLFYSNNTELYYKSLQAFELSF